MSTSIEQSAATPSRIVAILGFGCAGSLTMVAILTVMELWERGALLYVASAFIGAALSAFPFARAFGHGGWDGVALALVGAVMATSVGAFYGGVLLMGSVVWTGDALGLDQVLTGGVAVAALVWMVMGESLSVCAAWLGSMLALHGLLYVQRQRQF